MPELRDIGGGIKMLDVQGTQDQAATGLKAQLGLVDLYNQVERAPLEKQKLESQIAQEKSQAEFRQIEIQNQKASLLSNALTSALNGDYGLANQLYKTINPNINLSAHPDPKARANGDVLATDIQTGVQQPLNLYGAAGIDRHLKMQDEFIKDLRMRGITQKEDLNKWIRENIPKAVEAGVYQTPNEAAIGLAGAANLASTLSGVKSADIPSYLKSNANFNAALKAGQSRPAVKTEELPNTSAEGLAKTYNSSRNLGLLMEQFQGLRQDLTPQILAKPLNELGSLANLQSGQYQFLKNTISGSAFEEVTRVAGSTFTPELKKEIASLVPLPSDSVNVAFAKIAAMQMRLNVAAMGEVSVQEATNKRTGRIRELFQGKNYTSDPDASVGQALYKSLPPTVQKNKESLELYLNYLPASVGMSLGQAMRDNGNVNGAWMLNRFKTNTATP